MKSRLIELVGENKERLFPNSRTHNANSMQKETWDMISNVLSQEYPANKVNTQQVRDCFKNLKKDGKAECVEKKRLYFGLKLKHIGFYFG